MTDQTTPEPMADEETLPLAFSDQARRLLAEIDRLTTALDRSHTETRRLGVSLAETIHERHQLRTQLADAERTRRAALDVAADLTDERDQARAEAARAWPEGHAAAMAAMLDERDSLTAQLAAARELARRWQRDAHKHREIADARPGLTQIERAEARQAATEIEQCARGLHRALGPDAAPHEPVTATGAPGPDPSEGTAPTGPQEPTQAAVDTIARILVGTDWDEEVPYTDIGPRDTVAHLARRIIAATHEAEGAPERVDTTTAPGGAAPGPAPLTLAQAAGHLHDWARDLDDGTRTDWPAGHPDIIRGIRAAAEWLDARDRYETETREQHLTALREAGRRLGESFQQLGEAIRDGAAKARAAREAEETPEPAEPTWRDVIRTMRGAGIRLERIGDHGPGETFRRWDLLDMHGDEVGWFEHETSWLGEDWEIELGESAPKFSARSSELFAPADVLTLARLAGLIGDTDG